MDDKLVEHPMEFGAGVSAAVNACRQNGDKVGHRFRSDFAEKTDLDRTQFCAGYLHIQVRYVGHRERLKVLYIFITCVLLKTYIIHSLLKLPTINVM